jgi:hypothetical protein
MARQQFDKIDLALFGFFMFGFGQVLGIADVMWFEVAFADDIFNGITVGATVALLTIGIAYVTNDNDIRDMDEVYQASFAITIGLIILIPLVPQVEDLVTGSNFLASMVALAGALGYAAVAYFK